MHERAPRSYDPIQTRQALLSAALSLFQQNGFHATSVNDIVAAARVTKGAFYHHFDSKEQLLLLINREFLDHLLGLMNPAMLQADSMQARLTGYVTALLDAVERFHPNVTIFFQEYRYLDGARFAEVHERHRAVQQAFHDAIADGIKSGEFRPDIDPVIACQGVIGMCAYTYQWYVPGSAVTSQRIAEEFVAQVLSGIMPR